MYHQTGSDGGMIVVGAFLKATLAMLHQYWPYILVILGVVFSLRYVNSRFREAEREQRRQRSRRPPKR